MQAASRFTRQQRLLTAKDFSSVFNDTRFRVSSKHLLILARSNDQSCSRLGLVVSKKNVGHAVERNRVKRLCREIFRQNGNCFANIDIVIVARSGLGKLDNAAIIQLLESHFGKIALQQHDVDSLQ